MVERLVAWAVRNAAGVFLGILLLVAAGAYGLQHLKVDAFPDLTDVQVAVLVDAPGLSPLEMERLVAFPIEVAMNGLPRVRQQHLVFGKNVAVRKKRRLAEAFLAAPVGDDADLLRERIGRFLECRSGPDRLVADR